MIITRLKLKNFGLHRSLDVETNDSIVGLIGSNGHGKSTILKGIEYLFTGNLPDTASSWITTGEKKSELYAEFTNQGKAGVIIRSITTTTSSRQLLWDGTTHKSAKAVEATLSEIFGADKSAISNAVFINQGELDKLLFGKESERVELFIKVLNIGFCDKHANLLDGKSKQILDGIQDLGLILDEATELQTIATTEVKELKDRLKPLEGSKARLVIMNKARDAEAKRDQAATLVNNATVEYNTTKGKLLPPGIVQEIEASITSYEVETSKLATQIANYELVADQDKAYKAAAAAHGKCVLTMAESQKALEAAGNMQEFTARITLNKGKLELAAKFQEVNNDLAAATSQRDANATALQFATQKRNNLMSAHDLQELQATYARAAVDHTQSADWLAMQKELFAKGICEGGGDCPKCGLKLASGAVISEASIVELSTLTDTKQETSRKLAAQVSNETRLKLEADTDVLKCKTALETSEAKVVNGNNLLELLPNSDGADPELLKMAVEVDEAAVAAIQELTTKLVTHESLEAQAKARLDETKAPDTKDLESFDIASMQTVKSEKEDALVNVRTKLNNNKELHNMVVKLESDVAARKLELADLEALIMPIDDKILSEIELKAAAESVITGSLEQAQKNLEQVTTKADDIKARMAANEEKVKLGEDLKRARTLFKRDGLPRTFINAHFQKIADMVAVNLARSNCPFTVFPDPDKPVSFMFERFDNASGALPQSKMSGGQRVRLAVAFLMAVQQMLLPSFGFLVLDEPSQNLDDEAVNSLADLLTHMSQTLQNAENQIFVCDHSDELKRAFSTTISLN